MARPYKTGLDYFSFDVDFFEDEKITAISIEFGIAGEIIAIRLLCAIYRNGYYAKWDTPLKMKIAKSSGIKPEVIDEVVQKLVQWGFFDGSMFETYGILTSAGIQKRYLESTKRRFGVIRDYCIQKSNLCNHNVYNNPINVYNNPINDDNNAYKVNKSKVNKIKERESSLSYRSSSNNIASAQNENSGPPAHFLQIEIFESEFPTIDHVKEFQKCYDYYNARNVQINDWNSIYRNWLQKDYPKTLKPIPKKPIMFIMSEEEPATKEEIHEELEKARKLLLENAKKNKSEKEEMVTEEKTIS